MENSLKAPRRFEAWGVYSERLRVNTGLAQFSSLFFILAPCICASPSTHHPKEKGKKIHCTHKTERSNHLLCFPRCPFFSLPPPTRLFSQWKRNHYKREAGSPLLQSPISDCFNQIDIRHLSSFLFPLLLHVWKLTTCKLLHLFSLFLFE